jgi:hypothetical protein
LRLEGQESPKKDHFNHEKHRFLRVQPQKLGCLSWQGQLFSASLVLEVSRKEKGFDQWVQESGVELLARFSHPNGDAVIVVRSKANPSSARGD